MKLQSRITIVLLTISLVPLSAFSYITFVDSRGSLEHEIFDTLSSIAELKEKSLNNYFVETEHNLNTLTESIEVHFTFSELENILINQQIDFISFSSSQEYFDIFGHVDMLFEQFMKLEKDEFLYSNIMLIDNTGKIIYSKIRYADFGTNLVTGPYAVTPLGKTVQHVLETKEYGISPYEVYEPVSSEVSLFFIHPVFDNNDYFAGMIVVQIPFNRINSIMLERTGLGETGETVLARRDVNGNAVFISQLKYDDETIKKMVPKDRLDVPITHALMGHELVIVDAVDYRDIPVLSVTRYIEPFDWGFVAKQDISEAFSGIYNLRNNIIITLISVGIIVSIFSVILSSSIVKPLKRLEDNIEFLDDESEITIDPELISKKDEIGHLALTFSNLLIKQRKLEKNMLINEKFATISKIAGTIAHEIRNPIGTISNAVYIMNMNKEKDNSKNNRQLEIINLEVDRVNKIISEFYSFSKMKELNLKENSFNNIITDLLQTYKFPENITVKTELDKKLPKMLMDTDKIRQMIINIIDNAVYALEDKGNFTIRTSVNEEFIVLEFVDTGEGIPEDKINKI